MYFKEEGMWEEWLEKDCVPTLGLRRIDRGRFFEDFFGGGGLGQEQCVVLFNEGP